MKNGEEPCFPQEMKVKEYFVNHGTFAVGAGLTKREYFAAMAMQGFIAAGGNGMPPAENLAAYATRAADALLAELEKPTDK